MEAESAIATTDVLERVACLERALTALATELRTRRVVVVDDESAERVVIDTVDDVAEVRVFVPGTAPGKSCMAALFAAAVTSDGGLGAGLQVVAEGDNVIELAAWRIEPRRWEANLHLD